MAESILVSEIIDLVRDKTDLQDTQFITEAELIRYINSSWKELYGLIVDTEDSYYLTSQNVSIVSGTDIYSLPTDFYKLKGIDINITSTRAITAQPFNFKERNRKNYIGNFNFQYRYILRGDNVQFLPEPNSNRTATIWYIPRPATITATTDTINTVNGGYKWLVADVCVAVANKEESDPSVYIAEREKTERRIIDSFAARDSDFAPTVTDVSNINDYWYWGGDDF